MMVNSVTQFKADEGVCREGFNRRIEEINNAFDKVEEAVSGIKESAVNRNLLHNWYFANPVNSKGLSAYPSGANSTTIDRWGTHAAGCNLTDKGLACIRKSGSGSVYAYFCQYIDLPPELVGQKMTVSVLADSTNTVVATAFVSDDKGSVSTSFCWGSKAFGGNEDVVSAVGTVPDGTTRIAVIIYIGKADSDSDTGTTLIAAKLELGEEQTLAKKDSSGNWILCEMPDYAEQAAICAQYDSNNKYIGVDRAGHRNYLHNWYFANPVNSKGLTVYPQGSSAIFIDRWMKNGSLEVSLNDDGIVVSNASSYTVTFYQFVDTVKAGLNGREVTASVLLKSSTKPSMQMYYHDGTSQASLASVTGDFSGGETGLMTKTFTVPENAIGITVQLRPTTVGLDYCADTTFIAAKLELGSTSTLAEKDSGGSWVLADTPEYAEQAAICTQYDPSQAASWTDYRYIGLAKAFAPVKEYYDSFTLSAENSGGFLLIYKETEVTVTIPADSTVNFPIGTEIEVCRYWGDVKFAAASGVTINSVGGAVNIADVFGSVALKKTAANRWLLSGNLG